MSTANFAPMRYKMPLVVGGLGFYEDYKESYDKYDSDEYTLDMFHDDLNMEFDDAAHLAKDFSEKLTFHEVSVKGGYYQGFQFYVTENIGYYGDFDMLDNDEAHVYYDMCRSRVKRKADAEKNKIRRWLDKIVSEYGYEKLNLAGTFSNGEAVYQRV